MKHTALAAALFCALATAQANTIADKLHECRTGRGEAAVMACTVYLGANAARTPQLIERVQMLRAQAYIDQQKFREALADYAAATQVQPNDAEAWFNHAIIAGGLSKLDIAIADLGKAIALRPGWAAAYAARGAMHLAHGEPQKTIEDDDKALQLDPANYDAKADKTTAEQRLGLK